MKFMLPWVDPQWFVFLFTMSLSSLSGWMSSQIIAGFDQLTYSLSSAHLYANNYKTFFCLCFLLVLFLWDLCLLLDLVGT